MSESTALTGYSQQYVAKKAFFNFLGNTFRIFGTDGSLQFYVKQKAFKLKEDIKVYRDASKSEERLSIQARGVLDFSGIYDITDSQSGEWVGSAKRDGMASFWRDKWQILDQDGRQIGKVEELGGFILLLRKFFKFIPQTYEVTLGEAQVGRIAQKFNPFVLGYDCDFSAGNLDPRLGVGLSVLLLAIEGRETS